MKKIFYLLTIICTTTIAFSSCDGCVKKATKSITETGISAIEGVAEAVDENGERLGQLTADAAGKIALGVGKSLDKQLDAHASKVFSVTGRTMVQSVDGFVDGVSTELKSHYNVIPHTETLCEGVKLDYIARYKEKSVIDAYFAFEKSGTYDCKFECIDNSNNNILTKEVKAEKSDADTNRYTLVSFALDKDEEAKFKDIKEIKVTVSKK